MKKYILISILSLCFLVTGCAANPLEDYDTRYFLAMDTQMSLKVYGNRAEEALDMAEERIESLDSLLSTGDENSEIYALNQSGSGILSEDAAYLFERSMEIHSMTDGAFNPLVYPLMCAWGFADENYRVPSDEEISKLLFLTDTAQVAYDSSSQTISFQKEGMGIDFGGIAKGYTASEIAKEMKDLGVTSAILSVGGIIQTVGLKPNGERWKISIADPWDSEGVLGSLSIGETAAVTSGAYVRYFEENGVCYHHILDPDTGKPAESGLASVTIISEDGTLADGLSTALFVKGLDYAENFWKMHFDEFEAVLVTDDKQVYVTEGIADYFSSDYRTTVIRK